MPRSKSDRLAALLRTEIRAGRRSAGSDLPPRRELQQLHNVSSETIQKVVDELVADGFLMVNSRHGTRVAAHPPHLHRLALVLPELPGPTGHTNHYVAALRRAAARPLPGPCWVEVHHAVDQDPQRPEHQRLLRSLAHRNLAGVLLPAPWVSVDWLVPDNLSVPTVVTTRDYPGEGLRRVILDQRQWVDAALDHACRLGLQRLSVVLIADTDFVGLIAHLERGIAKRGMTMAPWMVQGVDERFPEWVVRSVQGFFAGSPGSAPDGLLVLDDNLLPYVQAGLRVCSGAGGLHLIAHANLPLEEKPRPRLHRIGWDVRELLARAFVQARQPRCGPPEDLPLVILPAPFGGV